MSTPKITASILMVYIRNNLEELQNKNFKRIITTMLKELKADSNVFKENKTKKSWMKLRVQLKIYK